MDEATKAVEALAELLGGVRRALLLAGDRRPTALISAPLAGCVRGYAT